MGIYSAKVKSLTMLAILLLCTTLSASARTVYSTSEVDIFPQGDLSNQELWYLDDGITFTSDNSQYTESMVEDDRITIQHNRPNNYQSIDIWSQSSTTNSTSATGSPDLQYSTTKGPVIELTDFDITSFDQYEIVGVSVVIAFHIPGALQQDQVRIFMNHSNQYEELVTYVNTQGSIDYINTTFWRQNITQFRQWSWEDFSNIIFTLDYVSLGNTDDTQLDVDAVGLSVIVKYPWYGTEWASVESISQGFNMPIMNINLSEGYFNQMQVATCGIKPTNQGTDGVWTSQIIQSQPNQKLGRIHYEVDSEEGDDLHLEYSSSNDGNNYSDFMAIDNHGLIDSTYVIIKVKSSQTCLSHIKIDYNDPTISIDGRIFGSLDGIVTDYSRWKVFVNDLEATFQPIDQLGDFSLNLSIGQYLVSGFDNLKIKFQAWFNWDSTGQASTTLLEISSIEVSGGFDVEWDEDPVCQTIGTQYLVEDGPGLLIPFLDSCQDDRDNSENLTVEFKIADEDLITATMIQDDIKLVLAPEQFGVTTITVEIRDSSSNKWNETFIVYVEQIDDEPQLNQFPALIPVEYGVDTIINFNYIDLDSNELYVSTNKSWAQVNLNSSTITVNPPSTGSSIPVLVTLCDYTTCVNRTLLLEVLIFAELLIENVIVDDESIVEGDLVPVRIYVRNSGQQEASSVSVRCQTETTLIAIKSIPLLKSGELGVVTCDWQLLESGSASLIVEVDRVNEISESDESNNLITVTIDVGDSQDNASSNSNLIDTGQLWMITIISVIAIILLFVMFAPGKIRKIE